MAKSQKPWPANVSSGMNTWPCPAPRGSIIAARYTRVAGFEQVAHRGCTEALLFIALTEPVVAEYGQILRVYSPVRIQVTFNGRAV